MVIISLGYIKVAHMGVVELKAPGTMEFDHSPTLRRADWYKCFLHRILRQLRSPSWVLWASALQCVAITWSTMATLQHVALDVFSGTGLGLLFAAASLAHIHRTD